MGLALWTISALESLADLEETIEKVNCLFRDLIGLGEQESDQDLPRVET